MAEISSSTELAYQADVSGADLIHGLAPVTTGWNFSNGAHTDKLTDGIHGATFAAAGNTVEGAWTTVGATAEYVLGAGANGLGYDITTIQSIAAWVNVGFGNQAWTIEMRPLGSSYVTVATIDYQPLGSGEGASRVTLGDLNATGIDAIRFTANQVNGGTNAGAFVSRELDVFGVATVPEPSALLLGAGGFTLLLRRRRP